MPHHFKWINRATLLFNLASAELVGGWFRGWVGVCGSGVIRDAQACLSLSWTDILTGRQMIAQAEEWKDRGTE